MRFSACTALLAVIVLLCVAQASAYNVVYSVKTTSAALGFPDTSGCVQDDGSLHMAMPITAFAQSLAVAKQAASAGSATVPLGGEARTAQCSDVSCEWVWNDGAFASQPYTFFLGVVYTANDKRAATQIPDTQNNGTAYCNFDSCTAPTSGTYPQYDTDQSYWGLRKVVMGVDGGWRNIAYNTEFTTWLCEAYEFQLDSQVNDSQLLGIPMFPPSHGGWAYPPLNISSYQYCSEDPEKRITSENGRWVYPKCGSNFPWWAGMTIALVLFVVLLVVIAVIWYCCCYRKGVTTPQRQQYTSRTVIVSRGQTPSGSMRQSRPTSRSNSRPTSARRSTVKHYEDEFSSDEARGY